MVNGTRTAHKQGRSFSSRLLRDVKVNYLIYLMVIPAIVYFLVFCYYPMYGAIIAFKTYVPAKGIWGSDWVGLKHFTDFFGSYYFTRLLKNTLSISLWSLIIGFPAPILLALMLNEVNNRHFKRTMQTISYLPYFVSLVVICGIIIDFTKQGGPISELVRLFGYPSASLLAKKEWFQPIYVASGVWQSVGWGSIIYLAAMSGIDLELYDAAYIDGAGRFRRIWHITLPGIASTATILLILNIGGLLNVGYEKIILLYGPATYETADVISTFTYRKGLLESNFGYSAAVGLFNSVVNFILLISANTISKRFSENSLW